MKATAAGIYGIRLLLTKTIERKRCRQRRRQGFGKGAGKGVDKDVENIVENFVKKWKKMENYSYFCAD